MMNDGVKGKKIILLFTVTNAVQLLVTLDL
jgi:hypothetical protein